MNIIFDKSHLEELQNKYTVLELDTIRSESTGQQRTAYCVVENVPILEMAQVESLKSLHANLMDNYRKQNWNYCEQAIEHLMGKWNGELDSFYTDLLGRIASYKETAPDLDWDSVILRP
jgi:hypothetical protein